MPEQPPKPNIDLDALRLAVAFREAQSAHLQDYMQRRDELREAYLACRRECDRLRKQNREYETLMLKEGVPFPRSEEEGP